MSNLRDRVKSQAWWFCTASSAELEGPLLLAAGHRSTSMIPADHRQSLLPAGHNIVHNVAFLMCVRLPTTNLYLRWTMIKFCFLTESRLTKPHLTLGEALAIFFHVSLADTDDSPGQMCASAGVMPPTSCYAGGKSIAHLFIWSLLVRFPLDVLSFCFMSCWHQL